MLFNVTSQYAHQEHEESTDLGEMSSTAVLKCFDEFDWAHQVKEANHLGKVSPTLSVADTTNRRLIWVSACGEPSSIEFVSECTFPGMKKRLFGLLGEGPGMVELHTQQFDLTSARRALELFMSVDETSLRHLYETN